MAERKPSLEGNWVYRLKQRLLIPDLKDPYPEFDIRLNETRWFTSFEEALKFLQKPTKDMLYNSVISQIAVGEPDYEHGAEWLFDTEGRLIDYAVTHSAQLREVPEAFFYGRPSARQRFKVGEIVECVGRNKVSLSVVAALPPSVEWCWNYRMKDKGYILDYSDDSALVLEGPSYRDHDHVSPLCLMKPRFPIPDSIRENMETWLECAEKEEKEYERKQRLS